jgi:predicted RecB family nuclease
MQRLDGRLIVSAHDLVGYVGCEHLTGLDLDVAEGKREKPAHFDDPQLDLLQKRGFEHEKRCLERLGAEGRSVREIAKPGFTFEGLENAEKETLAAMREGIGVVYQGTLLGDGRWRGHPDFLVRVEEPSDLGPWSYEPADAKLAQRVAATALLDFESDPWAMEGGLEFLIGTVTEEAGAPVYTPAWAHDPAEEKRAFECLVDTIVARLDAHPGTHVYHYGAYEAGAIKRLMGRYATREDEVDRLLRGGVLVDLFSIVRQGVRVSQESYSLKKVEKLYMPEREGPKTRPGFALVEYEKWMETRDQGELTHA